MPEDLPTPKKSAKELEKENKKMLNKQVIKNRRKSENFFYFFILYGIMLL